MAKESGKDFPYCYIPAIMVSLAAIICNITCLIKRRKIFLHSMRLSYSNLACAHILSCTFFFINVTVNVFGEQPDLPVAGKCLVMSIITTMNFVSFGNIYIITYERFYATKYASKYTQVFTNNRRKKIIITGWIGSMIFGTVIGSLSVILSLPILMVSIVGIVIVSTLLMMVGSYCYIKVDMSERRRHLAASSLKNREETAREVNAKKEESRLVLLAFCIFCSFFCLSVPLLVFNFHCKESSPPCKGMQVAMHCTVEPPY